MASKKKELRMNTLLQSNQSICNGIQYLPTCDGLSQFEPILHQLHLSLLSQWEESMQLSYVLHRLTMHKKEWGVNEIVTMMTDIGFCLRKRATHELWGGPILTNQWRSCLRIFWLHWHARTAVMPPLIGFSLDGRSWWTWLRNKHLFVRQCSDIESRTRQ